MPARLRLVASAGPRIGRGHLARALSLAEARWGDGVELELELIEGRPSPSDRARATAAGARLVKPGSPVEPGTIVVIDVPDPAAVADGRDPDRLVVFDDSERYASRAAVVVQPSMPWWLGRADVDRVVAGYGWVPIGAAWRAIADGRQAPTDGRRPAVLVCFGGSDPAAAHGAARAGDRVRSRVGHDSRRRPRLSRQASGRCRRPDAIPPTCPTWSRMPMSCYSARGR